MKGHLENQSSCNSIIYVVIHKEQDIDMGIPSKGNLQGPLGCALCKYEEENIHVF